MSLYVIIAPKWHPNAKTSDRSLEVQCSFEELLELNSIGYGCYFYPNYPSPVKYDAIPLNDLGRRRFIAASDVDVFEYVFLDLDMKNYRDGSANSHNYATKDEFLEKLFSFPVLPTRVVDSGNGIHAYWRVDDLDPMGFLKLARRLSRTFTTDSAVCQLKQLMRVPGTINTKKEEAYKPCDLLYDEPTHIYSSETLDKALLPLTHDDATKCQEHYDMAYNIDSEKFNVSEDLPHAFLRLTKDNEEVRCLFYLEQSDRSAADFRLGLLMFAFGLTADEAQIVLMQTAKASERSKRHRYTYAQNIINKIWIEEETTDGDFKPLSKSVSEIMRTKKSLTGTRFPCHPLVDATEAGFRLGEVLGLIGGHGNGKSSFCLNMFMWFIERSPEYLHLYVTLEMPTEQIAKKWLKMTAPKPAAIHNLVHILSNYNEDGSYRKLGLKDIEIYIKQLEKHTGQKVGSVVLDHLGILKQEKRNGDYGGLQGVCEDLKAFAVATNTFTIVQSQTSRSKNAGGDMELDIDGAFGVSAFEGFVDYVVTIWQPLKRIYKQAKHMTCNAFKFCKVRDKDVLKDKMEMDAVYCLKFEPETETLREMTSDEFKSYGYWNTIATKLRNQDRKKDPSEISQITWTVK